MKTKYFSPTELNTGRQNELDIAKGLAIIFMVWCHTYREMGADTDSTPGFIIDSILGGPFAAPVFMLCMGVGICFSRRNDAATMLSRGIKLLLLGYGLNLFRFVLPKLLLALITSDTSHLTGWFTEFMEVDILQFAGISFIVLALVTKLKISKAGAFALAVLLSILGGFLNNVKSGNSLVDSLLGLLWHSQEHSYFAFFNWFIFPAAGLLFGTAIKHSVSKGKSYLYLGFGVFALGLLLEIAMSMTGQSLLEGSDAYFAPLLPNALFLVTFAIAWCGVLYFLYARFNGVKIGFLQEISKNINQIFCLHWILLGLLVVVKELTWQKAVIGFFPATLLAVAVFALSYWITHKNLFPIKV